MIDWQVLQQIHEKHILVVGDLILDRYTFGSASRISPEAPVPVLLVEKEESLPGGAGNVALNLRALGQKVSLLGRVGNDTSGQMLKSLLTNAAVNTAHIYTDQMQTPTKVRLIASFQQMVRLDYEGKACQLAYELENAIINSLPQLLETVDAIAVSDYAKGFVTERLFQALVKEAKNRSIPVITDPKSQTLGKYSGTTILKPNFGEAKNAAKLPHEATIEEIALELFRQLKMNELIITRSEEGISLFMLDGSVHHYPVVKRQVRDVTGAGDTVLAVLAAGIASQHSTHQLIQLANIAASIAIERVGCASVTWDEVANRLFEVTRQEKVVQASEFSLIQRAFTNKPVTLIEVGSSEKCSSGIELLQLLQTIQNASRDSHVIAHVRDASLCSNTLQLLGSLEPVGCVVVGEQVVGGQAVPLFSKLSITSRFQL